MFIWSMVKTLKKINATIGKRTFTLTELASELSIDLERYVDQDQLLQFGYVAARWFAGLEVKKIHLKKCTSIVNSLISSHIKIHMMHCRIFSFLSMDQEECGLMRLGLTRMITLWLLIGTFHQQNDSYKKIFMIQNRLHSIESVT